MDQDSYWIDFFSYRREIEANIDKYSIFTPRINAKKLEHKIKVEKTHITSGTVYRIDMFKTTGLFVEEFFIDCIDIEFGYRANHCGFPTAILCNHLLKQQFGTTHKYRNSEYNAYGPFRLYHIMRNNIWMWRMLPYEHTRAMFKYVYYTWGWCRPKAIILSEDHKMKKLFAMMRGTLKGIFSKKPNPQQL